MTEQRQQQSRPRLPERVDPSTYVIGVPVFEDDRPDPEPEPPAAAPQLVAATRIAAQAGHGRRTIRNTQIRAGLLIAGIPICVLVAVAAMQVFLTN